MPVPTTAVLPTTAALPTTRHRIDVPIAPARGVCVVALDDGAAVVAGRVVAHPWANARFLVRQGTTDQLLLLDGAPADLTGQLAAADVVVMIATDDTGAACASAMGRACAERGIMTAGLVLGVGRGADGAIAALRPHARVLLPSADEVDVTELLTALRA
jgi:hypothetical protein